MLKVRSARNGEQRSKGGSAKRRLESLFAGLATASLLVTGLAGVAAADPVDETPQSDPAATETTANQGTGDDSVGTSDDAQSSDQDLNNGSDEGVVSQSEPRSNAARSFSPFAAGERNDKVVVRDILLDRVPAGSGQLAVGDTAHISAVWDATEADPKPGEYFTVTLPEEFSFLQDASGFPLKGDDGDGNEQTWANCTLETATRTVTCTFTDVVADWDEIWGTIEFDVKASKATTSESVEIDANGTVEVVDLPGEGGISNPAPLEIVKSGSLIKNNTGVGWSIRIPGQLLVNADQSPVYLYDTLSDSLQLCDPTGLKVTAYKNGSAVSSAPVPTAAIDTISLPDGADFRIGLTEPESGWDASYEYRVYYETCTTSGTIDPVGTVYRNDVEIGIDGVDGTGIGVTQTFDPDDLVKSAAFTPGERQEKASWTVRVPQSALDADGSFTLTDTLTGPHAVCGVDGAETLAGITVARRLGPSGTEANVTSNFTTSGWSANADGKGFSVKFTLNDSTGWEANNNYVFLVRYTTCVTTGHLPEAGDKLENSVVVGDLSDSTSLTVSRKADKGGSMNTGAVTIDGIEHNPRSTMNWTVTVPGEKLATLDKDLVLEDIFDGPHGVCPAGTDGSSIADRMNLKVLARDQLSGSNTSSGNSLADRLLDSSAAMNTAGDGVIITVPVPDPPLAAPGGGTTPGFSRDYQYIVTYTTCTDSGVMDEQGTVYGNSIEGYQVDYSGTVTQSQSSGGTGTGVAKGNFSVSKLIKGTAASVVPDNTSFTVHVKEIAPAGQEAKATEYDLTVPLNGEPAAGVKARGNGWKVELSEPTFPSIANVVFGTPQFAATPSDAVTVSEDGKTATVALTARAVIAVQLTNVADYAVGSASVTKVLNGNAKGAVATDKAYRITAKFEVPTGAAAIADKTNDIEAGETWTIPNLPVGTKVTFSEVKPDDTSALTWSTPSFTPSATATVTGDAENPAAVTLTNQVDWKLGEVSITKALSGEAVSAVPADQTFSVTASFIVPTGADPIDPQTKEIKVGETWTIPNLPVGTKVTFAEVTSANTEVLVWGEATYDPSATATVTGVADEPVKVTLTNAVAYARGSVSIEKVLDGGAAAAVPEDQEFTVTASFVVPEGADPIADRELSLKAGEPVALDGLPVGTVVTFSETQPVDTDKLAWGTPVFSEESVTVLGDAQEPVEVTLTNSVEAKVGSLEVTKVLAGGAKGKIAKDTEFPVTATWTDVVGEKHSVELKLKAGTPAVITDVQLGTEVTLVEGSAQVPSGVKWTAAKWSTSSDAAKLSADGKTAKVVVSGDTGASAALQLQNTFDETLPDTGLNGASTPIALGLGLLLVVGGVFLALRGRKA